MTQANKEWYERKRELRENPLIELKAAEWK